MELEKLNRRHWGKERGKIVSNREGGKPSWQAHKRLLNTENKLRVDGAVGEGKMGDGHGGHLLG